MDSLKIIPLTVILSLLLPNKRPPVTSPAYEMRNVSNTKNILFHWNIIYPLSDEMMLVYLFKDWIDKGIQRKDKVHRDALAGGLSIGQIYNASL